MKLFLFLPFFLSSSLSAADPFGDEDWLPRSVPEMVARVRHFQPKSERAAPKNTVVPPQLPPCPYGDPKPHTSSGPSWLWAPWVPGRRDVRRPPYRRPARTTGPRVATPAPPAVAPSLSRADEDDVDSLD